MPELSVIGAREHNLKNIDVTMPLGSLVVVTGLSGSGKSSLAFDTINAEGRRRYIETFSPYARGMMGSFKRPDVDSITGLSPVIAIEQKTTNRNPRSTIGTTTEIYDFLRLLYARIGQARSYISGEPMVKYTPERILELILSQYDGHRILVLAPLVRNRKGHYKELFERLIKKGYLNVRVDGEMMELRPGMKLDRYRNHTVEVVIDRLRVSAKDTRRLSEAVERAMQAGDKVMMIVDADDGQERLYSRMLMDPVSGLAYRDPAPHCFSFNSPQGWCPVCKGLGVVNNIDIDKIIPDTSKSIYQGAIVPLGKYRNTLVFNQIEAICRSYGAELKTPVRDLPREALDEILNGTDRQLQILQGTGAATRWGVRYDGVLKYIEALGDDDTASAAARHTTEQYYSQEVCPECRGQRLCRESLHFYIDDRNIASLTAMDIGDLKAWTAALPSKLDTRDATVAREVLKEIDARLRFLSDVGLDYLSLGRSSASLSGGESQRIRLATQLGSELVNVLYILDEPSIGLHQSDNQRLITSLKALRDKGNSVIVVEHDRDMMLQADHIIDIGPRAGRHGGEVVFSGTPRALLKSKTLTGQYLSGKLKMDIPATRSEGNGLSIDLLGCTGNNLKDVDLHLPLGTLTCISGVSGSGKSSLINDTLRPALLRQYTVSKETPLPFRELRGIDNIDKVITVDQSPLGKSLRSNPATYTGLFQAIRSLFVELPEAKIRGYKPGRFSFNVAGGRCETCQGNGYRTIAMNFLPNVLVPCETCGGHRYNRETLEVRYKGKSIADVLDMTIEDAYHFFESIPKIARILRILVEIGLGYLHLGQPLSTLSGGENQRVKLATELARKDTGRTLFILDEPTTGLHFDDIRTLMGILRRLVAKGNTVVVIEHNTDVLLQADHIIDMGPGGGRHGGRIVAQGTPEQVAASSSPTAPYLKQ